MESTHGPTKINTLETGATTNNMDMESIASLGDPGTKDSSLRDSFKEKELYITMLIKMMILLSMWDYGKDRSLMEKEKLSIKMEISTMEYLRED